MEPPHLISCDSQFKYACLFEKQNTYIKDSVSIYIRQSIYWEALNTLKESLAKTIQHTSLLVFWELKNSWDLQTAAQGQLKWWRNRGIPEITINQAACQPKVIQRYPVVNLVGGWALPLWKMMDFVSWDDDSSQYDGKVIKSTCSSHHQSDQSVNHHFTTKI